MLTHSWILTEDASKSLGNKKKNDGSNKLQPKFKINLKELLGVSSDWKDVNKKADGSIPMDF